MCLSQAPRNLRQSKYALEFGETFSQLLILRRRPPTEALDRILSRTEYARHLSAAWYAHGGVSGKYAMMRRAQMVDAKQTLDAMERLQRDG